MKTDAQLSSKSSQRQRKSVDYTIREIQAVDLGKGFLEVLENLAPVGQLGKDRAARIFHEIRSNPLHKIYVAVKEDGLVLGTTTLLVEPKFIFEGSRIGHIEDVAVRKEFGGFGIGSKLVLHATQKAKELGCFRTVLDCSDERMRFYEKLGYSYQDNCMRIQFW
jgi:glucosamine-phosphate N-acetyltransferase